MRNDIFSITNAYTIQDLISNLWKLAVLGIMKLEGSLKIFRKRRVSPFYGRISVSKREQDKISMKHEINATLFLS